MPRPDDRMVYGESRQRGAVNGASRAHRADDHRRRLTGRTRAISLGIAASATGASAVLGTAFAGAIPGHARPASARPAGAQPARGIWSQWKSWEKAQDSQNGICSFAPFAPFGGFSPACIPQSSAGLEPCSFFLRTYFVYSLGLLICFKYSIVKRFFNYFLGGTAPSGKSGREISRTLRVNRRLTNGA